MLQELQELQEAIETIEAIKAIGAIEAIEAIETIGGYRVEIGEQKGYKDRKEAEAIGAVGSDRGRRK